jgi:hypothetical protein
MKCNNENQFGNFYFILPYLGASDDRDTHQVVMFNNIRVLCSVLVFFIIMGNDSLIVNH